MIIEHEGDCCRCVTHLISKLFPPPLQPVPTVMRDDGLIELVAEQTGVSPSQIRGKSRERDVTYARHLAMYALKQAGYTLAEIGRLMGYRDHSTVIAGVKRITGELTTRTDTLSDWEAVTARR